MEQTVVTAVNYNTQLGGIKFDADFDTMSSMRALGEGAQAARLPLPQIIYQKQSSEGSVIYVAAPEEHFKSLALAAGAWATENKKSKPELLSNIATVTLTGHGLVNSPVSFEGTTTLATAGINVEAIINTPLSVSFLVSKDRVPDATRVLHEKFVL
jgi:aspartokinase